MMMNGWITIPHDIDVKEEKNKLERMGIKVGDYIAEKQTFINCSVNEESFPSLEYGYYEWNFK